MTTVGPLNCIPKGTDSELYYTLQMVDASLDNNDSYMLALAQPGVTLKAWHPPPQAGQDTGPSLAAPDMQRNGIGQSLAAPELQGQGSGLVMAEGQVLEGQGKGQFLGPPAQRWAAAALKDSINRSVMTEMHERPLITCRCSEMCVWWSRVVVEIALILALSVDVKS